MPQETPPPRPTIGRTTGTVLAVAAMFGAFASWILVQTIGALGETVPRVPESAVVLLGLLAGAVGVVAWRTHQHVQVRRDRIASSVAVNLLVVGKTALLAGAAIAGAYAMLALLFLPHLDAALARERVLNSGLAFVAAIALAVAGWFLERACIVPNDPDGDSPATPQGDEPTAPAPG